MRKTERGKVVFVCADISLCVYVCGGGNHEVLDKLLVLFLPSLCRLPCCFGAYHCLIVINLLLQAVGLLKNIFFCKTKFGENGS